MHSLHVGVDAANFAFPGGGLEPDSEVIGSSARCGICSSGEGNSVGDTGFEGTGLGRGA